MANQILADIIFYTERNTQGIYICKFNELEKIIHEYKYHQNYDALSQIIRELFACINAGRRPWRLESERAFLSIMLPAVDVVEFLHTSGNASNEVYEYIKPLSMALYLVRTVEHMAETRPVDLRIDILDQLVTQYILIFGWWASDFAISIELPPTDELLFLLETCDDHLFIILLTALAKTQQPCVKAILDMFIDYDEVHVQTLAKKLSTQYYC